MYERPPRTTQTSDVVRHEFPPLLPSRAALKVVIIKSRMLHWHKCPVMWTKLKPYNLMETTNIEKQLKYISETDL